MPSNNGAERSTAMTLSYDFAWEQSTALAAENGEAATWGYLRILLGSRQLWGPAEISVAPNMRWAAPGVRWTWIDLLEYLADSWPWLVGEQGWPPNILPADLPPAEFAVERRRALEQAGGHRSRFEQALFEFRERHDLAFALKGKSVPSLWIVRRGNDAWVGDAHAVLPWSEVRDFLVRLGDTIAERLSPHRDGRSVQTIARWHEREDVDSLLRAEAVTGLDAERLQAVVGSEDPIAALDLSGSGFESSELAAVARLAAPSLRLDTVKKLLGCIRATALGPTSPALRALSEAAQSQRLRSEFAYEEGWHLARWLRRELQLDASTRVEPDELLARWDVALLSIDLDDPAVDAVACWGPGAARRST
jgi:hypothetical protein